MSSVSSDFSDDDNNPFSGQYEELEWTEQEEAVLVSSLQHYTDLALRCSTPFVGLPPAQLTHAIARAVIATEGPNWRHSLKNTRSKMLSLGKLAFERTPRRD
jgi:hypothetical protein